VAIEVNYEGMQAIGSATDAQARALASAKTYVDSGCSSAPFHAGLLWLFGGQYDAAHRSMTEAMGAAEEAAKRASSTVSDCAARYHQLDIHASTRLDALTSSITGSAAGYNGPRGAGPAIPHPTAAKNTEGVIGVTGDGVIDNVRKGLGNPPNELPLPSWLGGGKTGANHGGLGDVVELVNNTIDASNAGSLAGEGLQSDKDAEDFIAKHKGRH